jgi:phage protein U
MGIGSFAGIVFEVSADKVLTINDLSRSGSARWAVHDVNQKKPMPEFLGPGQDGMPFKIILKASHGVNPEETVNILRNFKDTGQVSSFILGSKPVGDGFWYLDDMSEGYKSIDKEGRILSIDVTVTLKEYPKPVEVRSKPSTKAAATQKKPTALSSKYIGNVTIKVNMLNCRAAPSLKGKIVKVLRKNQVFKCYGTVKTDILWYGLGNDLFVSAGSEYTSFKKVETASVSISTKKSIGTGATSGSTGGK